MSQAGSQAHAFYREVAKTGKVWTIRDDGGFPAPMGESGKRSMPFWSSLSRVKKIIGNVPAYAGFEPVEMSWKEFRDEWLPQLADDDCLAGVNWSGPRAVGFDVKGETVRLAIEHYLKASAPDG